MHCCGERRLGTHDDHVYRIRIRMGPKRIFIVVRTVAQQQYPLRSGKLWCSLLAPFVSRTRYHSTYWMCGHTIVYTIDRVSAVASRAPSVQQNFSVLVLCACLYRCTSNNATTAGKRNAYATARATDDEQYTVLVYRVQYIAHHDSRHR